MLRQRSKWWTAIVVAMILMLVSSTALAAGKGGGQGQGGSQGGGQQSEDRGPSGSGNGDQDDQDDQDDQEDQDDQDDQNDRGDKGDKGDKGDRDDQDDQDDQNGGSGSSGHKSPPSQVSDDEDDQDSDDADEDNDQDDLIRGDADQGGRLDLAAIKASIAALTDETVKANLTGLVTAYETALANYKAALQTKADKATVKSCREALKAARKALLVALKEAELTNGQSGKSADKDKWKAPPALDLETIKAAIAALTDETVKASLTGLVTAYETALDNYQAGREADLDDATMKGYRDALDAARNALLTALKEAGITTQPAEDEDDQWEAPKALNLEAIKAIIAGLTDETTKANLTGLVTAYETALANYQAGLAANADDATMEGYRSALCTARKALLAALKDVGATVGQPKGPEKGQDNPGNRTPSLDLDAIQAAIAALADETTKANLTGLVTAYEMALANYEAGKDANADQATLKGYREAVGTARKALQTALKDAGIWDASTTPSAHSTVSTQQAAATTGLWGSVRQLFSTFANQFR